MSNLENSYCEIFAMNKTKVNKSAVDRCLRRSLYRELKYLHTKCKQSLRSVSINFNNLDGKFFYQKVIKLMAKKIADSDILSRSKMWRGGIIYVRTVYFFQDSFWREFFLVIKFVIISLSNLLRRTPENLHCCCCFYWKNLCGCLFFRTIGS